MKCALGVLCFILWATAGNPFFFLRCVCLLHIFSLFIKVNTYYDHTTISPLKKWHLGSTPVGFSWASMKKRARMTSCSMARSGCVEVELAYTSTTNGTNCLLFLPTPHLSLTNDPPHPPLCRPHRHFSNSSHSDGLVVSNAHKIDGMDTFGSFSGVLLTWTMQGESVFETAVPKALLLWGV